MQRMAPSLLAALLALSCGSKPSASRGGEEVQCPDGSANPGVSIRTVNCSTVVQFDGDEFEASLNVNEFAGAGIKNVDKVLREVSQAANDAQIQFTQTCELYNGCNLTSAEYRERLDETQAHFRRIREQVSLLEAAKGNPEVLRQAVTQLYVETVPPARVAETTLGLEFSLQSRDGSSQARVVRSGETLRTGDEVVFGVRTSQAAYVYIFQRKSSGELDVLFPNAQISTVTNPIPASVLVRIPPQGQVFTLDAEDLGEETVYIAASKTPLADLESALSSVGSGEDSGKKKVSDAMENLFDEGAPECSEQTRGLEVTKEAGCGSMTRGFTPTQSSGDDAFFSDASSVQGQTVPGDDVLIRTFKFQHVN